MPNFTDLPPEVRLQIFKYAFTGGMKYPFWGDTSSPGYRLRVPPDTVVIPIHDWAWAISKIGSTCEEEAREVLWRYNKVHFTGRTILKFFSSGLENKIPVLPKSFSGFLHSVTIKFSHRDIFRQTKDKLAETFRWRNGRKRGWSRRYSHTP